MRMQAQKYQDTGRSSRNHHGKEQRKDDDSRKRGRQHVTHGETARLRSKGGSGHS